MTGVALVPILLWGAALICVSIAVWREGPPVVRGFVIDRLSRYLFLFPLGIQGGVGFRRPCILPRALGGGDRLGNESVPI